MANILKSSVRGTDLIPIEDMLLEESELFLVGEINSDTASKLIQKLMYLDQNDLEEITLYINSPGGEVISGLAVYDYIKIMKSPVRTVTIGDAASMGAIIFLAGEKREMLPHTRILIHDPSYGHLDVSGKKPHEIQRGVDSLRACLVSSENNTNKSKREHLKRILKKSFAVFPKSAAFIKPAKGTFYDPSLRNNSKSMKFIAFNNFNCRT